MARVMNNGGSVHAAEWLFNREDQWPQPIGSEATTPGILDRRVVDRWSVYIQFVPRRVARNVVLILVQIAWSNKRSVVFTCSKSRCYRRLCGKVCASNFREGIDSSVLNVSLLDQWSCLGSKDGSMKRGTSSPDVAGWKKSNWNRVVCLV